MTWVCLFSIPMRMYWAWVVTWLWKWFAVPVFDLPVLSVPVVYGLGMLISLLRFEISDADIVTIQARKGADTWVVPLAKSVTSNLIIPTAALGVSWLIVRLFGPF